MTTSNTPTFNTMQKSASKVPRRRITVSGPCPLPPPPTQRAVRRSSMPIPKQVQFSDTSEVCVLDRRLITTSEDWYTLQDQARFKKERIVDLLSMRDLQRQKPVRRTSCPVGLEQFLSSKGRQESRENRKMIIQVVLVEQERQRTSGAVDHNRLAMVALNSTADEHVKAYKRGKFQEMARFMD